MPLQTDGFYNRGVGFSDTACKAMILWGMAAILNISLLSFPTPEPTCKYLHLYLYDSTTHRGVKNSGVWPSRCLYGRQKGGNRYDSSSSSRHLLGFHCFGLRLESSQGYPDGTRGSPFGRGCSVRFGLCGWFPGTGKRLLSQRAQLAGAGATERGAGGRG